MNTVPLTERIETALRELIEQGARLSITAVAAHAGLPGSSLFRNPEAGDLVNQRISETRQQAEANLVSEVARLRGMVEALAARVRNQEERLRRLEGRQYTVPR